MYAGEDGEVCVELGYVGKEISICKGNQPDKSKAGGWPAWFGEAPVDIADLVCRLCGRCLYLVTQVYAPTHVQRSLCVFGCNRAACSLRTEGWRVIRTQHPSSADPSQDEISQAQPKAGIDGGTATSVRSLGGKASPTPPVPVQAVVEPASDAWGASGVSWDAAAPDGDEWGAEASEWGAGAGAEGIADEATPDIDALLDEQEKRSSKAQGGRAAAAAAAAARSPSGGACDQPIPAEPLLPNGSRSGRRCCPAGASGADAVAPTPSAGVDAETGGGRPCFLAKAVSFVPEPWGAGSSGADDKDMQNRLRRYREHEEDRGLVAALDQALGLKDGGGAGNGSQQGRGGGVASIGEKYERTPARAKAVMRFADRVARSPQQVVRYAYGGQPLWSASDPPKEDVPPCACGATRLFEMQLMPALLLQLQANDLAGQETPEQGDVNPPFSDEADTDDANDTYDAKKAPSWTASSSVSARPEGGASTTSADHNSTDSKGVTQEGGGGGTTMGALKDEEGDRGERETVAMPTPSAEDRERLKTWGMDWGVVGIWSCPRSCEASSEERVVVQLPV